MENKMIDQKKYLQKYLNPKSKKKKVKKTNTVKRVNIIDDDVDFSQLMPVNESEIDLYTTGEDAPQIAGIIDERPIEVRLKDKFKFSQWKVINEDDGIDSRLVVKEYDKETGKEKEKIDDDELSPKNEINNLENTQHTKSTVSVDSDNDLEVPRKKKRNDICTKNSDSDNELPRKVSTAYTDSDEDLELPRKRNKINKKSRSSPESDLELPRNRKRNHTDAENELELHRREKRKNNVDLSRRKNSQDKHIKRELSKERSETKKKNESETNFNNEPSTSHTKNTFKFNIRNPDWEKQKAQAEQNEERKEKYDRWGKGLKQVSDRQEKLESDVREMMKPLARYADDEDLENFLKEQEREGDPMLEYIRKEKKEKNSSKSKEAESSKPKYEGAYMPNRFSIPPGYRWDGVDRSNGYEANWFKVQNSKKITEEEAYKWSVDDM